MAAGKPPAIRQALNDGRKNPPAATTHRASVAIRHAPAAPQTASTASPSGNSTSQWPYSPAAMASFQAHK
jgi:hypothetical protein